MFVNEGSLLDVFINKGTDIGAVAKAMFEIVQFEAWVKGNVLTRVAMLSNSEPPAIAYVTRMVLPWKKSSAQIIQESVHLLSHLHFHGGKWLVFSTLQYQ